MSAADSDSPPPVFLHEAATEAAPAAAVLPVTTAVPASAHARRHALCERMQVVDARVDGARADTLAVSEGLQACLDAVTAAFAKQQDHVAEALTHVQRAADVFRVTLDAALEAHDAAAAAADAGGADLGAAAANAGGAADTATAAVTAGSAADAIAAADAAALAALARHVGVVARGAHAWTQLWTTAAHTDDAALVDAVLRFSPLALDKCDVAEGVFLAAVNKRCRALAVMLQHPDVAADDALLRKCFKRALAAGDVGVLDTLLRGSTVAVIAEDVKFACTRRGSPDVLQLFLNDETRELTADTYNTGLRDACKTRSFDAAKLLLATPRSASVLSRDTARTVVGLAPVWEDESVVVALLNACGPATGFDVNFWKEVCREACVQGFGAVLDVCLTTMHVDPSFSNDICLVSAVHGGHEAVVRTLAADVRVNVFRERVWQERVSDAVCAALETSAAVPQVDELKDTLDAVWTHHVRGANSPESKLLACVLPRMTVATDVNALLLHCGNHLDAAAHILTHPLAQPTLLVTVLSLKGNNAAVPVETLSRILLDERISLLARHRTRLQKEAVATDREDLVALVQTACVRCDERAAAARPTSTKRRREGLGAAAEGDNAEIVARVRAYAEASGDAALLRLLGGGGTL